MYMTHGEARKITSNTFTTDSGPAYSFLMLFALKIHRLKHSSYPSKQISMKIIRIHSNLTKWGGVTWFLSILEIALMSLVFSFPSHPSVNFGAFSRFCSNAKDLVHISCNAFSIYACGFFKVIEVFNMKI